MNPNFVPCYILIQKVRSISQKLFQTTLSIIGTLLFFVHCKQTQHSYRKQRSPGQMFIQNEANISLRHIFNVSGISSNFTLRFSITILWTSSCFPVSPPLETSRVFGIIDVSTVTLLASKAFVSMEQSPN